MNFLKEGKTNWKFLLIVVVLAVIVGGVIFVWQYFESYLDLGFYIRILTLIIGIGFLIWWYIVLSPEERERKRVAQKEPIKHHAFYRVHTWAYAVIVFFAIGLLVWIVISSYLSAREKMQNIQQGNIKEEAVSEEVIREEIADWQTYRNEEYGVEFKYPESWNIFKSLTSFFTLAAVSESEIDPLEIYSVDEIESKFFSKKENFAVIYLDYKKTEKSLEDYRTEFKDKAERFKERREWRDWKWKDTGIEETEAGGMDAIKTYFIEEIYPLSEKETREKLYIIYYVLDKHNNGVFEITGIFQGNEREKYVLDFNQMLSAFRFLE